MRKRTPKPTDQENTHKAYMLLLELIELNQKNIEPTLWVGAMIGAIAENYEKSGFPFEVFKNEITVAMEFYKY